MKIIGRIIGTSGNPTPERRLLRFFELDKLNSYVERYGLRIIQFAVLPTTIRTSMGRMQSTVYYALCEGTFPGPRKPDGLTMNNHEQHS